MPRTSFDQLIAEWTPQDLVLCSTNAQGALVGNTLLERHRKRFPQELAPIRFAPPDNCRADPPKHLSMSPELPAARSPQCAALLNGFHSIR